VGRGRHLASVAHGAWQAYSAASNKLPVKLGKIHNTFLLQMFQLLFLYFNILFFCFFLCVLFLTSLP
jgi:hypothetical protein